MRRRSVMVASMRLARRASSAPSNSSSGVGRWAAIACSPARSISCDNQAGTDLVVDEAVERVGTNVAPTGTAALRSGESHGDSGRRSSGWGAPPDTPRSTMERVPHWQNTRPRSSQASSLGLRRRAEKFGVVRTGAGRRLGRWPRR